MGTDSGQLVAALLCLSIAGAVSAMTWAGPRVYWAMAQDGVIGSWLAQRHPETGVPARAIMLSDTLGFSPYPQRYLRTTHRV